MAKEKRLISGQAWWYAPLIPALRRQKRVDLCGSKDSAVYTAGSMKARATQ